MDGPNGRMQCSKASSGVRQWVRYHGLNPLATLQVNFPLKGSMTVALRWGGVGWGTSGSIAIMNCIPEIVLNGCLAAGS